MSFGQFVQILRARLWLILFTLAVTVGTTVAITMNMAPKYTASATLVINFGSGDPMGNNSLPVQLSPTYMATQIDILKSHRVARRVVEMLHLDQNPSSRDEFLLATQGRGNLADWLADALTQNLEVEPSRESRVVQVSYTSTDAAQAAAITNAFAKAYIDTTLEMSVEPARQSTVWLNEQLKAMRGKVEAAQSKVTTYQQKHGIMATNDKLDAENARIMALTNQLAIAQAEARDAESKVKQLNDLSRSGGTAALATFSEIQSNAFISNLKTEILRQKAKLSEMSRQYGENHPTFQRARQEISSLEQKFDDEVNNAANSIKNNARLVFEREQSLQRSMNEQKGRMMSISRQSEELNVLAPEKDSAQRAYDAVLQRFSQISMESQVNQTNVVMLNQAIEPTEKSSPKTVLNITLSGFLGLLLGIGMGLMFELFDRRIRSEQDLMDGLGVPFLGSLSKGVA